MVTLIVLSCFSFLAVQAKILLRSDVLYILLMTLVNGTIMTRKLNIILNLYIIL